MFRGVITSYEDGLWHVRYDDGDEEDLDADDLHTVEIL